MKDSKTGWGTLKGNQGTTYLEAARSCADSTGDPEKKDWSFEEEPDVRLRADGPGGEGAIISCRSVHLLSRSRRRFLCLFEVENANSLVKAN